MNITPVLLVKWWAWENKFEDNGRSFVRILINFSSIGQASDVYIIKYIEFEGWIFAIYTCSIFDDWFDSFIARRYSSRKIFS